MCSLAHCVEHERCTECAGSSSRSALPVGLPCRVCQLSVTSRALLAASFSCLTLKIKRKLCVAAGPKLLGLCHAV